MKEDGLPDIDDYKDAKKMADEWERLGKPGPDNKGRCRSDRKRAKGLKGIGAISALSDILNITDAANRAEENGINIWQQMMIDMGYPTIVIDSNGRQRGYNGAQTVY